MLRGRLSPMCRSPGPLPSESTAALRVASAALQQLIAAEWQQPSEVRRAGSVRENHPIRGCVTGHYVSQAFHGQHLHEIAHISHHHHHHHIPQSVIRYTHPVPEPKVYSGLVIARCRCKLAPPLYNLKRRLFSRRHQRLPRSASIAPEDGFCTSFNSALQAGEALRGETDTWSAIQRDWCCKYANTGCGVRHRALAALLASQSWHPSLFRNGLGNHFSARRCFAQRLRL